MSEEKLKECPFPSCGGKAELGEDHGIYNCHCVDCGVMSPEGSKEYVLNFWNTRQSSEAVSEALKMIDRFVDEINHSEEWIGKDLYSNNHIKIELTKIRNTLNQTTHPQPSR
jgi:hypothetical protein